MSNLNFDPTAYQSYDNGEISGAHEVLPKGDYIARIKGTALKPTKSGTGQYLEVSFEIADGEHTGKEIAERLNIHNQNRQAEEIARRSLKTMSEAAGVPHLVDSTQLHDRFVVVTLDIEQPKEAGRTAQNRVRAYKAVPGGTAAPTPPPTANYRPAPAANATPPWQKKAA